MRSKRAVHDMERGALRWVVAACNFRITQSISYNGEGVTCKRCLAKREEAEITGHRFGRFIAVAEAKERDRSGRLQYECLCDCGAMKTVRGDQLRSGNTRSCGCLARDESSARWTTHGKKGSKIFAIWQGMKKRCLNPRYRGYKNYGGRGISVCARWLESFENFLADMGDVPSGMSLDRIDNNSGYSPENCRWATRTEQNSNTRSNRVLVINGISACMAEHARTHGLKSSTVKARLRLGWTEEDAVLTPPKKRTALQPQVKAGSDGA